MMLSAFRFLKKNNAFLTADVSSSIGEESIIPLVTFSQSELIPTFTTNAVKVLVGEVEQKSGMTKNDFSSPVTYQFIMPKYQVRIIIWRVLWLLTVEGAMRIIQGKPR